MSRRFWMLTTGLVGAVALSATLFATAAGKNGPPDDRGKPSGVPASIQLTPGPIAIQCNGEDASTITVRVTDTRGKPVPDGTIVHFDVQFGFADPDEATTKRGEASTLARLYPYARNYPGVPEVDVFVGDLRASIGVDCAPPPDPCGPDASPPCPTPTPCGVDFSPPCAEPTPTCDPPFSPPTPFSPPCVTPTPGCDPAASPPCPIICDGGPTSPPCPTPTPPIICDGGPWSPPCPTPRPTRTPSNTSVFFAVDADLTTDGIQSSRPTSVPIGQNFTVDVVLFGTVIPAYQAYQIIADYDDLLFDPIGLPNNWQDQPVIDVSSGTPPGTTLWPGGSACDPSPTTNSVTLEDDNDRAELAMTCADAIIGELTLYQGVLLTLVFRCESSGTGAIDLTDFENTFLLDSPGNNSIGIYNDGVSSGFVTCGDGPAPPAPTATPTSFAPPPQTAIPTLTATPTPASGGLRPYILKFTPTPTRADNTDGRRRTRL